MECAKKILVVEDDEDQLELYRVVLEKHFQRVVLAKNGEEALKSFEKENGFPVVISDLKMPGLDGLGMAREILKHAPETRFILITAYLDDVCAAEAMGLGIFCLPKPVDPVFVWLTAFRAWESYKVRPKAHPSRL